jgi:membrane-associated HD superfamily phosphohydrolase
MYLLILFLIDATAAVMTVWAARALRHPPTTHSASRVRVAVTLLGLIMLTTATALFAAVAASTDTPPPREVDEPVMVMLFLGLAASLAGGFLAASSVEEARDTMWLSAAPLLPAFVMLLLFKLHPQAYGALHRIPIVALVLVALGFLIWSGYRIWRRAPPNVSVKTRTVMTSLSIGALVVSILLVTVVLVYPDSFAGLGDEDRPKIMVFLVGLLGAVMGAFMGASAVEKARDRLWPAGFLLLVLWVIVMNELEPGAW